MEAIQVERRAGLVTITLNRPAKKNAIDARIWSELDRTFAEVAADPNDRAPGKTSQLVSRLSDLPARQNR